MIKLIIALGVVIYLGLLPRWHYTLSGDIKNYYYPIARGVLTESTLIYPPGANLYFSLFPTSSPEIYELTFVAANVILLLAVSYFSKDALKLVLIVAAVGPIILYRFDVLVTGLVIVSILTFQKNRFAWSGFFLGLATITKIFPVILLPYFLSALWFKKKLSSFLAYFFLAAIGISMTYPSTLVSGFDFNFSKSVHMESVVGTFLTIITAFTNPGPHGVNFINGLWVLDPLYFLGHARIFRLLPILGLGLAYLFTGVKRQTIDFSRCLLLILTLVVTSQALSPQYVIWIAILYLFLPFKKIDFAILLAILVCTQIIYPLNYGGLIDFFNSGINWYLFIILATRNLLLVFLTIRLFRHETMPILQPENPKASI